MEKVGPAGRDFVEAHGEEAVAAVSRCSKDVAVKLAEFHAGGGLDKLPRPDDLPRAIARPGNGDDVCLWAIKHHEELEDADGFEAYVEDPLEYALGLKKLAAGAAEARARRQAALAAPPRPPPGAAPAAGHRAGGDPGRRRHPRSHRACDLAPAATATGTLTRAARWETFALKSGRGIGGGRAAPLMAGGLRP